MATTLTSSEIWADIQAVRSACPLVHSITNFVVMNLNANVLLAAGASPVMAHAHEEVSAMVGFAQSLVLNIGTLETYWIESMILAMKTARQRQIPVVLDPVGAGATAFRNGSIARIFSAGSPSVIRGNGSEIMSTAGAAIQTRGVDSSASANDAVESAISLVRATDGVVCVSGQTDHIIDAKGRHATLDNGHVWMTKITGIGCSATALIGAFCAVQPDWWRATVSAMALMSLAGEIAAEKAISRQEGVGSMATYMLDTLQLLDESSLQKRLKLKVIKG